MADLPVFRWSHGIGEVDSHRPQKIEGEHQEFPMSLEEGNKCLIGVGGASGGLRVVTSQKHTFPCPLSHPVPSDAISGAYLLPW